MYTIIFRPENGGEVKTRAEKGENIAELAQKNGVTVDSPCSGGGLCGIIIECGSNYSTVRSIIDDESTVYAMSQISADTCLVRGSAALYDDGVLNLTNIDKNARISNGDAIITSDLSTKYLPGLLIGYANDIEVNSQQLSKSGVLIPVADFDDLQEVLVIKSIKTDTGIVTPDEIQ